MIKKTLPAKEAAKQSKAILKQTDTHKTIQYEKTNKTKKLKHTQKHKIRRTVKKEGDQKVNGHTQPVQY